MSASVTTSGSALSRSRPLVPSGVLAMAMFIATEAMFFAGLISAFLVLRSQDADWPPLGQPRLPILVTGLNTLVLLVSGWTMQRAMGSLRRREAQLSRWLGVTAALGTVFVVVQGIEWVKLIRFGLTTSSSLYGATFYTLVGAHGLHVLAAVAALLAALRMSTRPVERSVDPPWLEPWRMYWLFVVAVWPILYGLVYLS